MKKIKVKFLQTMVGPGVRYDKGAVVQYEIKEAIRLSKNGTLVIIGQMPNLKKETGTSIRAKNRKKR